MDSHETLPASAERFIAERRAALAKYSKQELERMARRALRRADRTTVLREAAELRARSAAMGSERIPE